MVVLVLVVVWVLALTPYALRKLGEWQVSSELNRFRRGLGALGQFAPDQPDDAEGLAATVAGFNDGWHARQPPAVGPARSPLRRPSSELVMRRRRTLAWLLGSLVGSFLVGAIPWFRPLWDLSVFVLVLTLGYLGALAYLQYHARLAAERAAKVVRLRSVRTGDPRRTSSSEGHTGPPAVSAAAAVAVAAGGGGGTRSERSVVVALPRRPSFVLVDAPS